MTDGIWTTDRRSDAAVHQLKRAGYRFVIVLLPTGIVNGDFYFQRQDIMKNMKQYVASEPSLPIMTKKQKRAGISERILLAIEDLLRKENMVVLGKELGSNEKTSKHEESVHKLNTSFSTHNSSVFKENQQLRTEAVEHYLTENSAASSLKKPAVHFTSSSYKLGTAIQLGGKQKRAAKAQVQKNAATVEIEEKRIEKNRKSRFSRMKQTESMETMPPTTAPILLFKIFEVNGDRDKVFLPEIEVVGKEEYDINNSWANLKLVREAGNRKVPEQQLLGDQITNSFSDDQRPLWHVLRINLIYFALFGLVLCIMVTLFLCRKKRKGHLKRMIKRNRTAEKSPSPNFAAATATNSSNSEQDRPNRATRGDLSKTTEATVEGTASSSNSSSTVAHIEEDRPLCSAPATSHQDPSSVQQKQDEICTPAAVSSSCTKSAFDLLPERPIFKSILWKFFCQSFIATSARKIETAESPTSHVNMAPNSYEPQNGHVEHIGNLA
ncbi:hypothetical protein D918_09535 [Trichuris suis]|nr:hypothetical protein D918_09535 [Trichuris suis]